MRYYVIIALCLFVSSMKATPMNRRKFYQNTLWRDKLVEFSKQRGSVFHMRELTDAEYDQQLRIKLAEETDEVCSSQSRAELVAELGDVFEVIDALCVLHGLTHDEIIAAQAKKRDERGGFIGRNFVEVVEHMDGSFGASYCLAQPKKYPEIKD